MANTLFNRFSSAIHNFKGDASSPSLLLASEGPLSVYYAPFDWVNPSARVVLVGITPGRAQAVNALQEAKRQLGQGATPEIALQRAKQTAGFSGAMRPNLTAMLDKIGLATWLRIADCNALFGEASNLMQTAAVLPFPVFMGGENYNGSPDVVGTPLLQSLMLEHFVPVLRALPTAVFFPLGPVPSKALTWLAANGHVQPCQVLQGLPHPSGANAERIQYFLGRKEADKLSAKTDPKKIDAARLTLTAAVGALRHA